ncbi:pectinesterase family protein [Belliella marina]|uniref:Pectinesterase n=1 Tax=Belliella marina TaxID=1644146 RepID=A0ABW4VKE4_9BACT
MILKIESSLRFLVVVMLLLSTAELNAQIVNFYPQDGKVRDLKGKVQEDIVVAKDGTGDFIFIQDALDAIRVYLPKPITVHIKEGVYKEKLLIPGTITNVTFKGDGPDKTIITFDDHTGKNKLQTFDTYTLMVLGNSLTFKNLSIENSAGNVGQAVALHAEGDRLVFENCHFRGNQDTMFASGENSRQYFRGCYIEGTTDFIFGSATAYFEGCQIHSKSNSYITAASTPEWVKYGYVFNGCQLTADEGVSKVYLGRPWRDHAKTVFINCEMGSHTRGEGWSNWGREIEKTVFYAEYNNSGPGSNTADRVSWSKKLDAHAAQKYSLDEVFKGYNSQNDLFGKPWFGVVKDSSYTLGSATLKMKKMVPEAKPVLKQQSSNVKESQVYYKSLPYRDLEASVLWVEKGWEKQAGIVMVHGGGWQSGSLELMLPMAQELAKMGYVTMPIEYRLSREAIFPAAILDIKDAIAWLRSNAESYNLNPAEIYVLGCSAGAQLATLVGVTDGKEEFFSGLGKIAESDVNGIINIDGIVAFDHPESEEGAVAAKWLGGSLEENNANWQNASALTHAGADSPPILFVNGNQDRFHAGRDDLRSVLEKHNIYSEIVKIEDAPHTFWLFDPWFDQVVNSIDKFILKIKLP